MGSNSILASNALGLVSLYSLVLGSFPLQVERRDEGQGQGSDLVEKEN